VEKSAAIDLAGIPEEQREVLLKDAGYHDLLPTALVAAISGLTALSFLTLDLAPGLITGGVSATTIATAVWNRKRRLLALRRYLQRATSWAIPTTGVTRWLTAREPLLEIELVGKAVPSLVDDAIRAIDPSIQAHWVSSQILRVAIRPRVATLVRVASPLRPSEAGPEKVVCHIGDLGRLSEVINLVIAPLHAEVRVARITMGDASDFSADAPTEATPSAAESPFRSSPGAAPAAIQHASRLTRGRIRAMFRRQHPDLAEEHGMEVLPVSRVKPGRGGPRSR
jgi:hypothetical protein